MSARPSALDALREQLALIPDDAPGPLDEGAMMLDTVEAHDAAVSLLVAAGYTLHPPGFECPPAPRYRAERVRSRATDPSTSSTGGRAVVRRAGSQAHRLLAAYAKIADSADPWDPPAEHRSNAALTDDEAAALADMPSRSCWWKRCSELREDGLIEAVRDERDELVTRRSGLTDSDRMVCRITPAGRRELARLGPVVR